MEKRELKFRAWYDKSQTWVYFIVGQPFGDRGLDIFNDLCLSGSKFYQFTGLKDRGGNEIYEGDLLNTGLGRLKTVEYYKDGFWLNAQQDGAQWSLRNFANNSEIAGNIIENKNLLN